MPPEMTVNAMATQSEILAKITTQPATSPCNQGHHSVWASMTSNAMMATWLGYYVAAKLMWNVHTDVNKIKEEFYRDFFGAEAGPHVRAWWDGCEAALLARSEQPTAARTP